MQFWCEYDLVGRSRTLGRIGAALRSYATTMIVRMHGLLSRTLDEGGGTLYPRFRVVLLVRILTRYPCESGSERSVFSWANGPFLYWGSGPASAQNPDPATVGIGTGYSAGDEMPNAGCSLIASSGLIGSFRRFIRPFII